MIKEYVIFALFVNLTGYFALDCDLYNKDFDTERYFKLAPLVLTHLMGVYFCIPLGQSSHSTYVFSLGGLFFMI